jgi:ferric-dicitrate binding protein FerR (iron transport regulator)
MENMINKHILFENFSGRSTPIQKKSIEEWLQAPGNTELYYEWLDEWEKVNPQFFPDEEAALKKIMGGDAGTGLYVGKQKSDRNNITRFFRFRVVAAVIIFLSVAAGLFALKDNILYRSMSTAFGETRSVVLPDGSLVSMNAHSTIRYPRWGFGDKSREVDLSGEADFSVIHTKSNRPFLVRTDNHLDVVVLGTRFTVYTRGEQARVVLKQGKVELNFREQQQDKKLVLLPGDLFTLHAGQRNKLERVANPENLSSWKNHEFLFDSTSLTEFAIMIKDDFGLTINFENPALGEHRISGSFHADTASELLDVIAQLLDIHYKIKEDTIYFSE